MASAIPIGGRQSKIRYGMRLTPNDVGTDEFLTMCRLLEVEPYITVNAGIGDEWSAAQWVEYTNGSTDTPMGKQRAANGHPAPYGVKFWGVGNEMWGDYQYGYMPLKQFLWKHNEFAKAMREVDPSIKLIAGGGHARHDDRREAGASPRQDHRAGLSFSRRLDRRDVVNCFDNFDLISEHFYNFGGPTSSSRRTIRCRTTRTSQSPIGCAAAPITFGSRSRSTAKYEKRLPQLKAHPKPINLDEWAYIGGQVYKVVSRLRLDLPRDVPPLRISIRWLRRLSASRSLKRDSAKPELTANGLVFKLYRDHFGTLPVDVSGNSPQPKPTEPFGGEQPAANAGSPTFPLDVVAAWTPDRKTLTIAVLNPTDVEQSLKLE